ncbi:MAG: glycoside hydrolase family 3 C-terminal domain-containing protein [Promethearchaeota archaeon]
MSSQNEEDLAIYLNPEYDIEKRVEDLLKRLTLEEKFELSSGIHLFNTRGIKRLSIKGLGTSDGPHGVAAHSTRFHKNTAFPALICLSSTWNPSLARKFGEAIAEETRANGKDIILGPGINIHRTPLNGRTFEYFTEDPFLNSRMVVEEVKGIQSKRIAACVKHYACNNQETKRRKVNVIVDERTLEEIYLPAFRASVKEADAWTFMACYNKVNGYYGSENQYLIKEKLMKEWGFRGAVMSDWYATSNIKATENCVKAGLSLEMPKPIKYKKKKMHKALSEGKFTEEELNDNVKRILRVMFLTGKFDPGDTLPQGSRNTEEHQKVALDIAREGVVLLKNDEVSDSDGSKYKFLPLDLSKIKTIAVLGPNKNKKFYLPLIGGSSAVWPPYQITPLKALKNYLKKNDRKDIKIVSNAEIADVAIIFAGLNHKFGNDSEGKDRSRLELDKKQIELIKQTLDKNPRTIVVLINGSPIAMDDWIDRTPAIVESWYGGMEGGTAIVDVLFGEINPSGKLPITFPKKLEDSPAHKSDKTYPGDKDVYYDEGIFVGYRHFDKYDIEPLFPFGHGLSYTEFKYDPIELDKNSIKEDEILTIKIKITNTGDRAGAEVVQLYIGDIESELDRPIKELKGFEKVFLKPSESKVIEFKIGKEELTYYNPDLKKWVVEPGLFKVYIGSSSRDIRQEAQFNLE